MVFDLVSLPEVATIGIDIEHATDRAHEHRGSVRARLVRVVERLNRHGARHRDGPAFLHQSSRRYSLCRSDEVEGAELVVCPPAAPIRQLAHPGVVLLPTDFAAWINLGARIGPERNHGRGH